ncbi:LytTR family transcriptional regulator DNA-binding domain-containing protein [uncultured Psychroserpens sp.]|uniref:LytR/AlgR family response regulator transcription factor n=1 Tax=uncultured Psychroserpens sp. TaxID=255436 RepID=UPI002601D22E|nr:LytTR family transcriptional regulator DNA-binding domain-containing protein [uncultured Psychroserpens sp.]
MSSTSSKIKVLIVEDEIILSQDISLRLKNFGYEVVGIADSAFQAINILRAVRDVDIILMDIMIRGEKDGIELAEMINKSYDIPLIFLTSHADVKLVKRAKEVNPCAYLLKPFNDRQMAIAIELALVNFSQKAPEKDLLKEYKFSKNENEVLKIKDSLFLKKNHRFERVLLNEIQFLQAENNYTTIHTKLDDFLYSMVLKKLEIKLPVDRFLRVHRSYIVNIQAVQGFEGNMLFIKDHKIPVSKSHQQKVFKLFRTI